MGVKQDAMVFDDSVLNLHSRAQCCAVTSPCLTCASRRCTCLSSTYENSDQGFAEPHDTCLAMVAFLLCACDSCSKIHRRLLAEPGPRHNPSPLHVFSMRTFHKVDEDLPQVCHGQLVPSHSQCPRPSGSDVVQRPRLHTIMML